MSKSIYVPYVGRIMSKSIYVPYDWDSVKLHWVDNNIFQDFYNDWWDEVGKKEFFLAEAAQSEAEQSEAAAAKKEEIKNNFRTNLPLIIKNFWYNFNIINNWHMFNRGQNESSKYKTAMTGEMLLGSFLQDFNIGIKSSKDEKIYVTDWLDFHPANQRESAKHWAGSAERRKFNKYHVKPLLKKIKNMPRLLRIGEEDLAQKQEPEDLAQKQEPEDLAQKQEPEDVNILLRIFLVCRIFKMYEKKIAENKFTKEFINADDVAKKIIFKE